MDKKPNQFYVDICELYIGRGMQIRDISTHLNIDHQHVSKALSRYFKRPENPVTVTIQSIINDRTAYVISQWDKQSTKDIAADLNCNPDTIWEICRRVGINTKKRVLSSDTNYPQIETAIILNNETGVFHFNEAEVAKAYNVKKRTLNDYFNGFTKAKRWHRFERYELN